MLNVEKDEMIRILDKIRIGVSQCNEKVIELLQGSILVMGRKVLGRMSKLEQATSNLLIN